MWMTRPASRCLKVGHQQAFGPAARAVAPASSHAFHCSSPSHKASAHPPVAPPVLPRNSRPRQVAARKQPVASTSAAAQVSPRLPKQLGREDEPAPIDAIFQQRKLPLVGAGFAALCLGLYVSLLVSSYLKPPGAACTCANPSTAGADGRALPPTGRPPAVDAAAPRPAAGDSDEARQSAAAFDKGLDVPEWLMGITGLRRRLAAEARGHVLEVAVGTGRNLSYYDWSGVAAADDRGAPRGEARQGAGDAGRGAGSPDSGVLSFTGVDISTDMMSVARTRLRDAIPALKKLLRRRRLEPMPEGGGAVVDALDSRVRLCIADAERGLPAPAVPVAGPQGAELTGKYDTIIQTFGLCSVSDPARLLSNMASMVRPGSGRIILLEHGRGWYDWVNGLLDKFADPHFKRYGCWWNRDIEGIVREATQTFPALEVVRLERPLLMQVGTTLLIELRVKPADEDGRSGEERETAKTK